MAAQLARTSQETARVGVRSLAIRYTRPRLLIQKVVIAAGLIFDRREQNRRV